MSRLVDLASIPPFEVWGEDDRRPQGRGRTDHDERGRVGAGIDPAGASACPGAAGHLPRWRDDLHHRRRDANDRTGRHLVHSLERPPRVPRSAQREPSPLTSSRPSATTGHSRCWSLSRRSGPARPRDRPNSPRRRRWPRSASAARAAGSPPRDISTNGVGKPTRSAQSQGRRPEMPAATPAAMTSRPAVMPVSSQPGWRRSRRWPARRGRQRRGRCCRASARWLEPTLPCPEPYAAAARTGVSRHHERWRGSPPLRSPRWSRPGRHRRPGSAALSPAVGPPLATRAATLRRCPTARPSSAPAACSMSRPASSWPLGRSSSPTAGSSSSGHGPCRSTMARRSSICRPTRCCPA